MSQLKREREMRASYKLISALFAIALLAAPTTAQQLAKSGTFTGKFSGEGAGDPYEIGKGHVFFVGHFNFVLLNDAAGGFLDKSEMTCPGATDIVNGLIAAGNGYCVITGKDGDKAFFIWEAKDTAPGTGGGTFKWTGGTGKYTGLQGHNTFRYTGIGNTTAYSAVINGDWRLP